jgi:hypothetical protein
MTKTQDSHRPVCPALQTPQFYYLDQTQPAAVQCWLELWMSGTKHSGVERNELTVVMCYRKTQLNKHSSNAAINNITNATAVLHASISRALDEHVLVVLVIVIAATVAHTVASTTPTLVHVVIIIFLVVHAEVIGGLRVLDVV